MSKRNTAPAYLQNKPAPKSDFHTKRRPRPIGLIASLGEPQSRPGATSPEGEDGGQPRREQPARFIEVHRGDEPTLVNLADVSKIFTETVGAEGDVATRTLFKGERSEIPRFCDAFLIRESLGEVEALIRQAF